MSISERRNRKNKKKLEKDVNSLKFNCPHCGTPVPMEAFSTKNYGMEYACKICGRIVYEEFKKKVMMMRNETIV